MPEILQFPTKGAHDAIRDPFKTMENSERICSMNNSHGSSWLSTATQVPIRANERKMLFTENGIPKSLQCDNSTQFTCGVFQQLASQYGFEIVTSSPHYPRGHGFIEHQFHMVKKMILKCRETKEDIDLALLALRTTPLSSNIPSPSELLNV